MNWAGRTAGLPMMAAMLMSAVACASGAGSDGGEGAASCAYRVQYEDRTYRDVANVKFVAGKELGTATVPPCDDTGDRTGKGDTETAYEVDGISPAVAIAVGGTAREAKFVAAYSGNELPPEIQKLIDGS
ncbi:DUF6281 family protein [Streptomyces sp. LaBMicrA B280]|uniref:DUF6281 family protein n=1 Tax=Streptomyces sp. LaBMicrA B280 TaxID=3391001 RepID=UPI003BA56999